MEWKLARTNENKGYKIINVYQENGKNYATCEREWVCKRCGGAGRLPGYEYVEGGICFECGGVNSRGKETVTCRVYTPEEREAMDKKNEDRKIATMKKGREEAVKLEQEWKAGHGIGEDDMIYIVANCNSYNIKDILKDAGARFMTGLGWYFGSENKPEVSELNLPAGYENMILFPIEYGSLMEWNIVTKRPYFLPDAITNTLAEIQKAISASNAENPSQFVGEIGDRLRKKRATFISCRQIHTKYGESNIYTFTIDKNVFIWFTQSEPKFELLPGKEVELSGTIKDHKEYDGIKQTYLSRCILKEVA